jgi:propionyl-CoA carboxylase alpha chain
VQVLGDKHGHVIHLGERECSIQRRNQKIVEEAPSPAVNAKLRAKMGAEAVALAKAVGYDSAGTVEFVMGEDRSFYFLEMNTRLQVEHPVTEMVTGLDLVEQMIRVAAGEKLGLAQKDVKLNGWAVESRLYAEDPYREFLPSIGRLTRYRPPEEGTHGDSTVRVDGGVVEGSEISIYFDPLIAKITTHGPDRATAVKAMSEALDATVVDGIAHNQPFLATLMAHPRWQEGRLSTSFIKEEFPNGFAGTAPDDATLRRLAAVALSVELARRAPGPPRPPRSDWVVKLGTNTVPLELADPKEASSGAFDLVSGGGEPITVVSDWKPGEPVWQGVVGGFPLSVQVRPATAGTRLSWRGVDTVARVMTPRVAALDAMMPEKKAADTSKTLRCPMPGLVVSINVADGQKVRAGEALAVVEAMKMENVLRAERDATVAKIDARPGDVLAVDAAILEFE